MIDVRTKKIPIIIKKIESIIQSTWGNSKIIYEPNNFDSFSVRGANLIMVTNNTETGYFHVKKIQWAEKIGILCLKDDYIFREFERQGLHEYTSTTFLAFIEKLELVKKSVTKNKKVKIYKRNNL